MKINSINKKVPAWTFDHGFYRLHFLPANQSRASCIGSATETCAASHRLCARCLVQGQSINAAENVMQVPAIASCIFWEDLGRLNLIITAQGGGGSSKDRKPIPPIPIGEVSCCDPWMEERTHWWIERWLRLGVSHFLFVSCSSLSNCLYLSLSVCSTFCPSISLMIYRLLCLSTSHYVSIYL